LTEVKEFKETIKDKFKEIIREKGEKYEQVRLWTQDETRIGLMPIHRKRITGKGIRPLISSEIKREYGYLFGMIEPLTGKDFMMEMPSLETATMQVFINEFEQEDRESLHLILVDNASPHTTEKLTVGENIVLIFLPANSPELNPIERFWKELKDWLSDYEPETMKEVSKLISQGLKSFSEKTLSSITSFEYLMTAWLSAIA
jgi:transposase